jgi:hypothetical protein
MTCRLCDQTISVNSARSLNFHFPGDEGLDKPTVWIFPEVVVCLDCALAELTVPEAELRTLAQGATA